MRTRLIAAAAALALCLGAVERASANIIGYDGVYNAFDASSENTALTIPGSTVGAMVIVPSGYHAPGSDYGVQVNPIQSNGAAVLGTTALIRENTSVEAFTMQWRNRSQYEVLPAQHPLVPTWASYMASDVVNITGSNNQPYVLQMSYNVTDQDNLADGSVTLGWLNPTGNAGSPMWMFAPTKANITNNLPSTTSDFFNGSYDAFRQTATYTSAGGISDLVGWWGIDTTNRDVWAVLNYDGTFAVVPEPGTLSLLAAGALAAAAATFRRWKSFLGLAR
jgi:hypothetical protein